MGHPKLKKKSKRLSCKTRYKIDKKVREHNRKKRRDARKQRKGPKKNELIVAPNICPFKQQIVEEMNQAKLKEKEIIKKNKMETDDQEPDPIMQIVQDAQNRARGISVSDEVAKLMSQKRLESASQAKNFTEVVASVDVVLEVVDARDPLGTRCKAVESMVIEDSCKRLVIVVNKADLVPRDVLEQWLTYLRRRWPAVPFRASVERQAPKLGQRATAKQSKKKVSASSSVGSEFLMEVLANHCRIAGIVNSIVVGVVGRSNVGKKSVMDCLKRLKSCTARAEDENTRKQLSVPISENVRLLTSPGIVRSKPILRNHAVSNLMNLLRANKLHNPVEAAETILAHAKKEQMMRLYNVPDYLTNDQFLVLAAQRFGLLGKKGIPDALKACRMLIRDLNRGKISFYTTPPEDNPENPKDRSCSEIVAFHAEEFALPELATMETNLLNIISKSTENSAYRTYLHVE